jgi:hypothetical protein
MRINYTTHPILKSLESGNPMGLKLDVAFGMDDKMNAETIMDLVSSSMQIYKQVAHRYYLTTPFVEAIEKANEKIVKDDLHLKYVKPDCGIMFVKNVMVMYLKDPQDNGCKLTVMGYNRDSLTSFGMIVQNGDEYVYAGRYYAKDEDGNIYSDSFKLQAWLESICSVLYFIDNCEVETKVIASNKKDKFKGEKYLNETSKDYTVLDCGWFTELIRDTPFHVNGHLRWQPCGERHTKRKLIWVDSFEKKGYKRNAKKQLV